MSLCKLLLCFNVEQLVLKYPILPVLYSAYNTTTVGLGQSALSKLSKTQHNIIAKLLINYYNG